MSPFSHLLYELRLRYQIRQSEMAELLGYEQSYISALEIGAKGPPTDEFIERLIVTLDLPQSEQQQIRSAATASQRKLTIPLDGPQDLYWMLHGLREQLDTLHPMQIRLIQEALNLKGSLTDRQPEPLRRIKRRRREEATM